MDFEAKAEVFDKDIILLLRISIIFLFSFWLLALPVSRAEEKEAASVSRRQRDCWL